MSERSAEHLNYIEETRKICERIVEFVNPGVKVPVFWKKGEGWYWNFQDNYIVMDENDLLNKSREYSVGVALHEALHVWMSRTEHFSDEEWSQLGFAIGFNFAEDCGIENAADRVHKDGRKFIKAHLDVDVRENGGLDITVNKTATGELGYIPKHMILGGVMRQYFHGRQIAGHLNFDGAISEYGEPQAEVDPQKLQEFMEFVKGVDPDVEEVFGRIRPLLEDFWSAVPEMYDDEESIQKFAHERAETYRSIWDEYKNLVEKSVSDQSLKDFIEELVKGGQFSAEGDQPGKVIVIDFNSLPPEVQEELTILIQEQQEAKANSSAGSPMAGGSGDKEEESESQETSEDSASSQPGSGQGGGTSQESVEEEAGESGSSSSEATAQDGETSGESPDGQSTEEGKAGQVPWDKVSPESKEKIKESFDQLSDDERKELQDKATQELGEVEDKVNEQISGKTDRPGVKKPTQLGKPPSEEGEGGEGSEEGEGGEGNESSGDAQSEESSQGDESPSSSKSQSSQGQPGQQGEAISPDDPEIKEATDEGLENFQRTGSSNDQRGDESDEEVEPVDTSSTDKEIRDLDQYARDFLTGQEIKNTIFDKYLELPDVKEAVEILKEKLEPLFKPTERPRVTHTDEGDDVDIDRFMERKLGEYEGYDLMVVESQPLHQKYRFTILLDLSGSMDDKLDEAFKMIVVLSEVLTHLGIEFEVQGFTDFSGGSSLAVYKPYEMTSEFGDVMPDDLKQSIGAMLSEQRGGTPTSRALLTSYQRLITRNQETRNQGKKRDIFITLTDGQPTDWNPNTNMSPEEYLKAVVEHLMSDSKTEGLDVKILGLGIGAGTEFVNSVFPSLPDDLKVAIAQELNDHYYREGLANKVPELSPDEIGNSFLSTFELTVVLPIIFEYIIKHPTLFDDEH